MLKRHNRRMDIVNGSAAAEFHVRAERRGALCWISRALQLAACTGARCRGRSGRAAKPPWVVSAAKAQAGGLTTRGCQAR